MPGRRHRVPGSAIAGLHSRTQLSNRAHHEHATRPRRRRESEAAARRLKGRQRRRGRPQGGENRVSEGGGQTAAGGGGMRRRDEVPRDTYGSAGGVRQGHLPRDPCKWPGFGPGGKWEASSSRHEGCHALGLFTVPGRVAQHSRGVRRRVEHGSVRLPAATSPAYDTPDFP